MENENLTQEQSDFYNRIIDELQKMSIDICKANGCTEDNHFCESIAYFDWNKDEEVYELVDVCLSDYRTKCDDSYIPLPIPEDYTIGELLNDLSLNDIREDNE